MPARSFRSLPLWVVIRLCVDDLAVVDGPRIGSTSGGGGNAAISPHLCGFEQRNRRLRKLRRKQKISFRFHALKKLSMPLQNCPIIAA
jgi:hypothetical protein